MRRGIRETTLPKIMQNVLFLTVLCIFFLWLSSTCYVSGDCRFLQRRLENGRIIYQSFRDRRLRKAPENYLLKFVCSKGYTIEGPKEILCKSSKWSGGIPMCIEMQCFEPPRIQNGRYEWNTEVSKKATSALSVATYVCNRGYELENDTLSTVSCLLDSDVNEVKWIGEIPRCIKKEICLNPGTSPNGRRAGSCCFKGDILKYSCNDDFELVGEDTLECLSGGNWSSVRPLCRPMSDYCETPPDILYGVITGDKRGDYYELDEEVEITCDPGYGYQGSIPFVVCEEAGWDQEFEECVEAFCDPPEPLVNGRILEIISGNLSVFPFNFQLTYVCDSGYRLIGESWRHCDNGWSGETPHCEVIKCPNPGTPENGIRQGENFEIGEKVLFKCFSGYELLGSFQRYCEPNGQWSGELASCNTESNYCPDPGIPINGWKNTSTYDLGVKIGFHCRSGFTLIGSEVRECLPDKTWSGKEVKCLGPYDFDNVVKVSDFLKASLDEKLAELEREKIKVDGPVTGEHAAIRYLHRGRRLDLSSGSRLVLYFVFDASGSIRAKNFRKSIGFAKALVKRVGISEGGNRAGAVTFSSESQIVFDPLQHSTTDSVLEALDEIQYTGGGTSTNTALEQVRIDLIPLAREWLGKNSKSVIFILTDGKANMGGDPQKEAEKLKETGAEIHCVGITGKVLKDSLYNIASDPKEDHVFILQNYDIMDYLIQDITNGTIDYSQCGLARDKFSKIKMLGRIAGGQIAPTPWPWMAAIYFAPPKSFDLSLAEIKCGGTIINKNYILTAAHCLFTIAWEPRSKEQAVIKLGLTNVDNITSLEKFGVKKFIIHPSYREGPNFDYDIALLRLERPITFNAFIRPICLPPADFPANSLLYKSGEEAVSIGFGYDGYLPIAGNENNQGRSVKDLKEVILPIQSTTSCNKIADDHGVMFSERMMCAGDGSGRDDTCSGDSGGPLMQSQQDSNGYTYWTEVGIVSWGFGCRVRNTYGYYTNVQKLLSWITETIKAKKSIFK